MRANPWGQHHADGTPAVWPASDAAPPRRVLTDDHDDLLGSDRRCGAALHPARRPGYGSRCETERLPESGLTRRDDRWSSGARAWPAPGAGAFSSRNTSSGARARRALLSLVRLSSEQPIERCGGDLPGTDSVCPGPPARTPLGSAARWTAIAPALPHSARPRYRDRRNPRVTAEGRSSPGSATVQSAHSRDEPP